MAGTHRAPTRTGRRWTSAAIAVTGVAGALGAAPSASGDPIGLTLTSTVVTPDDAHGFGSADTKNGGATRFTTDYGAPSGGHEGALETTTPDSGSKAQYFTGEQNGPLSDFVGSASYATYKDSSSTGNAIHYPSYQIAIDANGGTLSDGGFSTLFYEPYYNVADPASDLEVDTWQKWDVGAGRLCSTRAIGGVDESERNCSNAGLRSLEEVVAANPAASVIGFGVNQGSGNPGITAAVDLLEGGGTTYDFEVTKPVVVVPDPDPVPNPDPDPVPDPDPTPPPDPDDHPTDGDVPDGRDGDDQGEEDWGKDDWGKDDWGKDDWGKDDHHGEHHHGKHHARHHHAEGDDEDCPDE